MTASKIIRESIWSKLRGFAVPDSRFHLNLAEYIPDFAGSGRAMERLVATEAYQNANHLFVTPDNCLTGLRETVLNDGKGMVVSTYGIYRGFVLLTADMVPAGQEMFASWLDGLEHFGKPVSLPEVADLGPFDLMVTGASAVSMDGVRFGKGHGFFDLEWGMFTDLGLADETTPVIALVHDCQVVTDKLYPSETDILVDQIATPDHLHIVARERKRPRGVHWNLIDQHQIDTTPPLQELQRLQGLA
jgi:5-formyltetrahydrofolate cyclo-ligase